LIFTGDGVACPARSEKQQLPVLPDSSQIQVEETLSGLDDYGVGHWHVKNKGTLLTRLNNSASSVGVPRFLTFTGYKAIGYRR